MVLVDQYLWVLGRSKIRLKGVPTLAKVKNRFRKLVQCVLLSAGVERYMCEILVFYIEAAH